MCSTGGRQASTLPHTVCGLTGRGRGAAARAACALTVKQQQVCSPGCFAVLCVCSQ